MRSVMTLRPAKQRARNLDRWLLVQIQSLAYVPAHGLLVGVFHDPHFMPESRVMLRLPDILISIDE
jgi:hypothetical protein